MGYWAVLGPEGEAMGAKWVASKLRVSSGRASAQEQLSALRTAREQHTFPILVGARDSPAARPYVAVPPTPQAATGQEQS